MATHDRDWTKYAYLPIRCPELDKLYQDQKAMFWRPSAIDFSCDRADWGKLNVNEQNFIKMFLAFFAQFDGLVMENLEDNFKKEVGHIKEAVAFYAMQDAVEMIHKETYSIMINAAIRDTREKTEALNAIQTFPALRRIADWVEKWMTRELPLLERLIAFACIEGVLFSGAFCSIYWIKKSNRMEGLCKANEWIARDERLHVEFATRLFHRLIKDSSDKSLPEMSRVIVDPVSQKRAYEIVRSCVDVSRELIDTALPVELIGINSGDMTKYIMGTADSLLLALEYEKLYNASNPLDWMAIIALPNKTSFFESRVSEYSLRADATEFEHVDDF